MIKSPEGVLKSIKEAGVSFIKNPNKKEQKKSTSLELCFDLVYEALDPKQKWLLMYLSLFPAGCKVTFLEILVSKDSIFKSEMELKMSIAFLSQTNLIDINKDYLRFERTSILNPIRIFVRKKTGNSSRELLHKIQLEAFQNLVFEAIHLYTTYMLSDEIQYGIIRYEIELPNYLFAFKKSVHASYCDDCRKYSNREKYLRIIIGISAGLYKYLFTRGKFSYGIEINKQGAKAHIELKEYDLAVDDLTQVATLNWRIGNKKETESTLLEMQNCEALSNKRFSTVRFIEGEILRESNPIAAIEKFEEGISIYKSNLYQDEKTSESNIASLLSEIGRTYERYLNDCTSALEYYLRGYHIQREMKDFANMFCNSHHIGNCYANSSLFEKSLEYYQEALEGFVSYGQQQYIGNSLYEIGKLRVTNPDLDYSFLTKDLLTAGLKDIQYEIEITEEISFGLKDKLWRIIGVVALSEHSLILTDWAKSFFQKLENKHITPLSLLYFFVNIAIVSNELENDKNNSKKLRELKFLSDLNGSEVEHDILDPFSWLSLWLKEKNIADISRGDLYFEIETEFWDNYEDEFLNDKDNE